jgi:low affinity Fe/Cu permease
MRRTPNAADGPPHSGMAQVMERNIRALLARRRQEAQQAHWQDRLADRITAFTGSLRFVYCHLAIYGLWIVANLPGVPLPHFDPTYVVLAMVASVEAIFLSTFILITQNRMTAQAAKRADLDLQVSLLAEHDSLFAGGSQPHGNAQRHAVQRVHGTGGWASRSPAMRCAPGHGGNGSCGSASIRSSTRTIRKPRA